LNYNVHEWLFLLKTFKVLNGLLCADVPLRNYSLTRMTCSGESQYVCTRFNSHSPGKSALASCQCLIHGFHWALSWASSWDRPGLISHIFLDSVGHFIFP